MLTFLKKLRRDERGVSALEYAILAAVILAAVLTVAGNSGSIKSLFANMKTQIDSAVTATNTQTP